jgi:hypothetical protein
MISNKKKLKEYVNQYPDQVYVDQNNLFNINYKTQEIGYAGLKVIVDNMIQPSGQYNQHKKYIIDYMKLQYCYASELEIDPSDGVYELAQMIYQIAREDHNIFTAYSVFIPFIDDIEFENKLLDKIGDNIGDEEFVEYMHNDDTQILGGRIVPKY